MLGGAGNPRAVHGRTAALLAVGLATSALAAVEMEAWWPLLPLGMLAPLAYVRWSHQALRSMRERLGVIVEERHRLAEIVSRSTDGIFTVDGSGAIESWNPAMESMT